MTGTLGFSRVGLAFLLALLAPNLLWRRCKPRNYDPSGENRILLMVLYELWWLRYFRSERTMADFTASLLGIPVAGASLPVAAFFLLGVYGRVIWMPLGAAALGIGHIGIHLCHRREISKESNI